MCYKCKCVISAIVLLKIQLLNINTTEFYKIAVHVFVKFVNPIFVIEYKSVFTSVLLKCESFFQRAEVAK